MKAFETEAVLDDQQPLLQPEEPVPLPHARVPLQLSLFTHLFLYDLCDLLLAVHFLPPHRERRLQAVYLKQFVENFELCSKQAALI